MKANVLVMLRIAAWTAAVGAACIAVFPGFVMARAMREWSTSFAGDAARLVAPPLLAVYVAVVGGVAFFLVGSLLDGLSAKLLNRGRGNPIALEEEACGAVSKSPARGSEH